MIFPIRLLSDDFSHLLNLSHNGDYWLKTDPFDLHWSLLGLVRCLVLISKTVINAELFLPSNFLQSASEVPNGAFETYVNMAKVVGSLERTKERPQKVLRVVMSALQCSALFCKSRKNCPYD